MNGDNCVQNSASMDATQVVKPPEGKPKRKRRKITKSCAFCRKRKLRCDQKRPICSTCAVRGFAQCEYLNEPVPPVIKKAPAVRGDVRHDTFKDDLSELQREGEKAGVVRISTRYFTFPGDDKLWVRRAAYQVPTADNRQASGNQLSNFFCLQCKDSGRRIFYGATAFKTFMSKHNWELMEKFAQAWSKLKGIRVQWKKKSKFSMLKELTVAEEPFDSMGGSPASLLSQVIQNLPTRQKILSVMNFFFDNNQLFIINDTLDREKVLRDFEEEFQHGDPRASDGECPIVALVPPLKKNYYKIGVILMILSLAHYRDNLPSSIERFLTFLAGASTAKTMYVERAQMLLLRSHYRFVNSHTGGDESHLMLLIDSLVSTAVFLGLNRDVSVLYKGQESVVGNLESLQKLWYWTLFLDLEISLNLGRPLKISPFDYNDELLLADHSKTFYGVMKRFLKAARPMLSDVHYQKTTPDLSQHCETLIDFIEQEFPPLDSLSSTDHALDKCFLQTKVLCQALSVLIAFYGLRYYALKESNPTVKNSAIKTILVSCSLCVNLTLLCFELDKKWFPEMIGPDCRVTTPYLSACMGHMFSTFVRSIAMFYAFSYSEMTFFEKGLLIMNSCDETTQCDLSTLRSQSGPPIAFGTYFKIACEKTDLLIGSSDPIFRRLLRRSQAFVILLGLMTVMGTVVHAAIQSRTQAESSWLSNSSKNSAEASSMSNRTKTAPGTDESDSISVLSENVTVLPMSDDYNVASLADNLAVRPEVEVGPAGFPIGPPMVRLSDQMESEMAQLIEEEFWGNYNLGWQEILDSTDLENLFPDYIL